MYGYVLVHESVLLSTGGNPRTLGCEFASLQDMNAIEAGNLELGHSAGSGIAATQLRHCPTCTVNDSLRSVLELLSMPHVKR